MNLVARLASVGLALAAAALVCAWGGVRARRRVRQRIIAMTEPERPLIIARWTVSADGAS